MRGIKDLLFNPRIRAMLLNAKVLLELGPIVVFFLTYKFSKSNLLFATASIVGATLICLALRYFLTKKLSKPLLLSGLALAVAGGITLITGNTKYIKMKPTVVFIISGLFILWEAMFSRFFIQEILGDRVRLQSRHWRQLSIRMALFFLALGVANEVSWRMLSEKDWVNFKIFGSGSATILFALSQLMFIGKHERKQ